MASTSIGGGLYSDHMALFDDDDEMEDDDEDDVGPSISGQQIGASTSIQSQAASNQGGSSSDPKKKLLFGKELRCMMYGFGDDKVPYKETIELLDELVVEFITDVSRRALDVGKPGRLQLEDIWYLIRRDQRKYARVKELMLMNEELKKARRAFDESKYNEVGKPK